MPVNEPDEPIVEIDVELVAEPEVPEDGVIDPVDVHTEGVQGGGCACD